jgi:CRISPR/Cas system CMR-associated protein Cmr5 small subunit
MLFKPKSGLWFAPDTGNGTGTPPATQLNTAAGGESNAGGTGPQSNPPATPPATKPLTFESEKDLERYIEDALKDRLERANKKAEKLAQDAREQAEANAAAQNGEWQKLAETREGKIKELSAQVETIAGLQTTAERYEKALKAYLETQRTGLPAHVVVLLDKLDPVDQLEYIAKNREALSVNTNHAGGHIPPTPPAGTPGQLTAEQMNQARNAQRAQTMKNF